MSTPEPTDAELLSERFDHEAQLPDHLPSRDRELVKQWNDLGIHLRSIPVQSIDLSGSVRRQLNKVPVAASVPTKPFVLGGRSSVAVIAATVTVLCCCAALWFLPPPGSESGLLPNVSSTFTPDQLATGFAKCDIVVVTMPEGKEATSDWLQASFDAHGMQSHAIGVNSEPIASQASRLVGADVESQDLLSVMNAFENELNPAQIDEMDRDELLSRFVKSLETPSLAQEHFDELVVVLPRELLQELRTGHAAELLAGSADDDTTESSLEIASEHPAATRPVLFVIRRRKAEAGPVMDGVQLEPIDAGQPVSA